jgi:hypothetical protein
MSERGFVHPMGTPTPVATSHVEFDARLCPRCGTSLIGLDMAATVGGWTQCPEAFIADLAARLVAP